MRIGLRAALPSDPAQVHAVRHSDRKHVPGGQVAGNANSSQHNVAASATGAGRPIRHAAIAQIGTVPRKNKRVKQVLGQHHRANRRRRKEQNLDPAPSVPRLL